MKEILKLSTFSAIAALFILSMLRPFGIQAVKENQLLFFTAQSAIIFTAAVISLCLLRYIFNVRLDRIKTKRDLIKTLVYFHIAIQFFMSTLMLLFVSWYYPSYSIQPLYCNNEGFTLRNFGYMNIEVFIISAMLFIVELFMYGSSLLQQELDHIKAINTLLEERQEEYARKLEKFGMGVSNTEEDKSNYCKLTGSTKDSVLELDPKNIVYVESMANYAEICYIENEEVKHKTMRITLKQIQDTFTNIDFIVPTHRAFLANLNFVVSISGQASVGFHLQMFGIEKEIPVSRSNTKAIREKLTEDHLKNNNE